MLYIALEKFIKSFSTLLFPSSCVVCGGANASNDFSWLCWDCRLKVNLIKPPFCERCGDPLDGAVFGKYLCTNCQDRQKKGVAYFDVARSAARYGGVIKEAVLAFKYGKAFWLMDDFALFILGIMNDLLLSYKPDAVTYVPLYHSRERHRTYNQARLLAEALAKRLKLPMVNVLKRYKFTFTQTQLTASQRRDNVRGVFRCINLKALKCYKTFIIVDDVITTGATMEECARVLKHNGVSKVIAISVARG